MTSAPHLAQFNFARARFLPEHPQMAGFVDALDEINHLADQSPGFIWRFQTDSGHSIDVRPFPDDPLKLITLSTWRDIESLRQFVYRTAHARYLGRRDEWFEHPDGPYLVMWWRDEPTSPSITEGIERLEHLRRDGPSFEAFDMHNLYQSDGSAIARHHKEQHHD